MKKGQPRLGPPSSAWPFCQRARGYDAGARGSTARHTILKVVIVYQLRYNTSVSRGKCGIG